MKIETLIYYTLQSEWRDVYGLYTPRRNVTITPEYVTPAETAAPRDAYEPNQGARDL